MIKPEQFACPLRINIAIMSPYFDNILLKTIRVLSEIIKTTDILWIYFYLFSSAEGMFTLFHVVETTPV